MILEENKIESKELAVIILMLSIVFSFYYLDIGFAFKPYMIFSIVFFVLSIKSFKIHKLYLYEIFLLLFFVYYVSTGIFASYKLNSLRMMFGVFLVLFCYFLMRFIFSKASIESIEKILSRSGVIFNGLSLILYVYGLYTLNFNLNGNGVVSYGVMLDRNFPRLIGLSEDPNIFAFYNFVFFFYYITHVNEKWSKLGIALSSVSILLTMSRGALLAIGVALILMFLSIKLINKIRFIIVTPLILFVLNWIIGVIMNINVIDLLINRFTNISGGSGRYDIWNRGIELMSTNPVFGVGINNYRPLSLETFGVGIYMHNSYMEALVEGGALGILLYLLIFITTIITYYSRVRFINDNRYLIYTFIAVSIMMSTYSFMVNEIFFLVLALLWRYFHEVKHPNKFKAIDKSAGNGRKLKRKKYKLVW